MNLSELAKAAAARPQNHSVLIYGPPKSGKTRLVGTAAKIPELKRIFWFDLENGIETLIHMGLSEAEMAKIVVFKVANTRENPIAIETFLRAFSAKTPIQICDAHGKVVCMECQKEKAPTTAFCLKDLTHDDLVVIDSGSELGDSALAAACRGKPVDFKPTFDEYGSAGKWLGDIMSVVQQAIHTNFVMLTHEIALEDADGKDKFFPLVGTKAFSLKVAKYFGTVVYTSRKLGKHVAGSSSTYRPDVLTGSRVNAKLEDAKDLSMEAILIEGGILTRNK